MRIFNLKPRVLAGFAAGVLGCGLAALGSAHAAQFTSPQQAQEQGISAYRGGYFEMALPALEFAAEKKLFFGAYYLAELYANNNSAHTDHAKAYLLYQNIANDFADVDPDGDRRARYVAHSLTSLAKYVRDGLPEVGVKADPRRAADYLHHAALFFNHEDAQFELAKMQIAGEGVRTNVPRGRHWLATLARKGHAPAQAFLADLLWRGKHMKQDQVRALALISVAVKNAPAQDRVWIEDIYQNIYCGASKGVHSQATGMVAEWDNRYGRKPDETLDEDGLGVLTARALRTCGDGRKVEPLFHDGDDAKSGTPDRPTIAKEGSTPPKAGFMQGGASGFLSIGETRKGSAKN